MGGHHIVNEVNMLLPSIGTLAFIFYLTTNFVIKADYEKQIHKAGQKLVVIKFFASWCGHCTMIKPMIENLHNEFKNHVIFLEVDIDENAVNNCV